MASPSLSGSLFRIPIGIMVIKLGGKKAVVACLVPCIIAMIILLGLLFGLYHFCIVWLR